MKNAILAAWILLSNVAAETLTVGPIADTSLFENSPGNNLGRVNFMPVGLTSEGKIGRGLLKFDLSTIPPGATVTSASLRLTATRGRDNHILDLHRFLVPWTEGIGAGSPSGGGSIGTAARPGEPTWNHRQHNIVPWQSPGSGAGSDYEETASAFVTVDANKAFSFQSPAMISDLQAWIQNPESNHGWLIKARDESTDDGSARRYSSREAASGAPLLTVTYEAAPEPTAPTLENPSLVGTEFTFQFTTEPSIPYRVESTQAIPPAGWQTLTNIPAGESRTVTISAPRAPGGQFYRVEASSAE